MVWGKDWDFFPHTCIQLFQYHLMTRILFFQIILAPLRKFNLQHMCGFIFGFFHSVPLIYLSFFVGIQCLTVESWSQIKLATASWLLLFRNQIRIHPWLIVKHLLAYPCLSWLLYLYIKTWNEVLLVFHLFSFLRLFYLFMVLWISINCQFLPKKILLRFGFGLCWMCRSVWEKLQTTNMACLFHLLSSSFISLWNMLCSSHCRYLIHFFKVYC